MYKFSFNKELSVSLGFFISIILEKTSGVIWGRLNENTGNKERNNPLNHVVDPGFSFLSRLQL